MQRIGELDGLRAILAFWVVFVHISKAVYDVDLLPLADLIYNENTRVKIFFMISGMVVIGMLAAKKPLYGDYMRGRLLRIYPAFFVALVLSLLVMPIGREALQHIPFDAPQNAHRLRIMDATVENLWLHLAAHLTMLHGVVPHNLLKYVETAIIGQAWNISTEFQFYIVAPALLWILARPGPGRWIGLACVALCVVAGTRYPNSANLGANALFFAIGIASYYVIHNAGRLFAAPLVRYAAPACVMVVAAAVARSELAITIWLMFLLLVTPYYLGFWSARPLAALASPAMVFLGKLSYSVYLSHMVVMYPVLWLLNDLGLSRTAYFLVLLAATTLGATALAYAIHRFVEEPFARMGRTPDRSGKAKSALVSG